MWAFAQEGWTTRAGNRRALLPGEAVSWHDGSHNQAMPDPQNRWTARPRLCGVHLTCCTFLGPSLAATKAKPVVCLHARVWAVEGREGPCEGGGGKCGLVLQTRWGGLGA